MGKKYGDIEKTKRYKAMKRKIIETSMEAYSSLNPDSIEIQQQRILKGLKELKTATADEMCVHLGIECWRRFSDLVKDGKIVNTGAKRLTRKNRNAFVFALPDQETNLQPTEKIIKGKGISDYSKAIQNIGESTQGFLFP